MPKDAQRPARAARKRGRPPKAQIEEEAPEPPKSRKSRKRTRSKATASVATTDRTVPQKKHKIEDASEQRAIIFDALHDMLTPFPASSSASIPQNTDVLLHRCTCDACDWKFFAGIRYKCAVCEDYDLCSPCYDRNVHDLTHPFMRITKPGGQPTYLSARSKDSNPPPSTTAKPATPSASCNPSMPAHPEQVTSPPSSFFYNTMSTAELQIFLTERGVEFGDALDTQTLCRRAWDTHCDCMSLLELNTFLLDRSISTTGCRDVNSKRQKAKDVFQPPTTSSRPSASFDASTIQFRKHDTVVLMGLNKAEMNGQTATVVSVLHAEGKALVKVEALEKIFKTKLENLEMQDSVEAVEELE